MADDTTRSDFPELVALDLGNSRLKAARFKAEALAANRLPVPDSVTAVAITAPHPFTFLEGWVAELADQPCLWVTASVNPAVHARLINWLKERGISNIHFIDNPDQLPLQTRLPAPERAGIDRLVNAVAVNVVRPEGTAAIVVDAGSAVTIDTLSADGVFLGGAIFPGLGLQARALAEFTEKLPLLSVEEILANLKTLPATSTPAAMASGLFWAMVGAVREIVARTTDQLPGDPLVVFTGGGAESLVPHQNSAAVWLPHLTLQGICHAFRQRTTDG